MSILVVGANGATGNLLVEHLLNRGQNVKVIVRSPDKLAKTLHHHDQLTTIQAKISDLTDTEMMQHLKGCGAVVSCLGHTPNLRGIYGHPRALVTDATRRLCAAIKANKPEKAVRFILMNTAGNSNRNLSEPRSLIEKLLIGLVRIVLPPHADNENAAEYLRVNIGQDDREIEWVVVRPDTLCDADNVTAYELYPSPTRSAIFNAGRTSRINVGHFMADLITDDDTWNRWKGQMPVIYNRAAPR